MAELIPGLDDDARPLSDLLRHRTLSGDRPVGDELRIEAMRPIRVVSSGLFDKYRVLLRDPGAVAWIKVGEDVASGLGQYDNILPGGNEVEEYCERSTHFSIMFDIVPATPVEVYLYAGRYALPK